MTFPIRKRIRLSDAGYRNSDGLFSVTIGTTPRAPVFSDLEFGRTCLSLLSRLRDDTGLRVYAYCLMPDHVHLLVGLPREVSLTGIVGRWKSECYRARRRAGERRRFWQRSFFDHGLRGNDDLLKAADYILQNPVRAGFVRHFRDYPLCGSFEFDL